MGDFKQKFAGRNIWLAYKILKKQTQVIRCGYSLFGVYKHTASGFDTDRSESDLEHAAGVQEILSGLSRFYPDLIPPHEAHRYLELARLHDIGENEISDLPDDGTQDVEEKHRLEKEVMLDYLRLLPNSDRTNLSMFYLEFQDRSSRRGRIMYLADKLEAVLQGLIYESEGRAGDLTQYPKDVGYTPSEQDNKIVEAVGETSLVDMWSYHFYMVSREYDDIKDFFLGILYHAVMDVRGKWFTWWPNDGI